MRVILAVSLAAVVSACATTRVVTPVTTAEGSSSTGAATSRAALDQFFAAIKSQDIQATSVVWGSRDGSARDRMPRDEMETRILTMQCFFSHDAMRVLSQPRQKTDSIFYRVELTKGPRTQQSDVVTVAGPRARWYVAAVSPPQVPGCAVDRN
jgi:hypothetical protein